MVIKIAAKYLILSEKKNKIGFPFWLKFFILINEGKNIFPGRALKMKISVYLLLKAINFKMLTKI